jgi:CHAT domain-containing protein
LLRLLVAALLAILLALGSRVVPVIAQDKPPNYDAEVNSARRAILEGHVTDGIGRLAALARASDLIWQRDAFWQTRAMLADFLDQMENYAEERTVIESLLSAGFANPDLAYFQPMQLLLGRSLAHTGHADEGEKILRSLTGGDERLVRTPLQRSAARVLSTIELDRDNIGQASIWMRRAVIGTMVDKRASPEEIVDTLTDYATYLRRIRQPPEANSLFLRLGAVYISAYPSHSPKFLHYSSEFLQTLRSINLETARLLHENLKANVTETDIVAGGVREQLFYQDLYDASTRPPADGQPSVSFRLEQLVRQFPDWVKRAEPRIAFSYFALLEGDVDLADKFVTAAVTESLTPQFAAYQIILKSYIAARREQFDASYDLLDAALGKITLAYRSFANEYAFRSPTIPLEERWVLGAILGRLAPHVSTPEQADVVFRLQQYLNRDRVKLGLGVKIARQGLSSDLLREDVRTRDRLKDLRERIMNEAVEDLLARTLPATQGTPSSDDESGFLTRLEDVEERIANTDTELNRSAPDYGKLSRENLARVIDAQRLLKPDEALVVHTASFSKQLVTACITQDNVIFGDRVLSPSEIQQLDVDTKLVWAALRGTHEPSPEQDSSFPIDSSFRIYQMFFGNIEACLKNRKHILLAPDADFLMLPWNALLLEQPDGREFHHRAAKWLPRTYALSLLPSVGSLRQLRQNLPISQARSRFLGIGDPDFKGEPERSTQIALAPLFNARGGGDREAIASLPRLPETAAELHQVATALGATDSDLILGRDATERGLRRRPLEDYRVISFATHAVVAGEIEGATEPALILSPGEDLNNSRNDGLLTASEIADLSLDANLVILSACNTAGPDGRLGGRGLSGLADAFFFAGARAVAVTQWSVYSDAAQRIGAGLVSRSVGAVHVGVAEGLRRTMVDYIDSAPQDSLAHPRFWASYIIAGDGAVGPLDGISEAGTLDEPIGVAWQHVFDSPEREQIIGLARGAGESTDYAIGVASPPAGEKRAGSYIARVGVSGNTEIVGLDREMAASGLVSLVGKIGVIGSYPSTCTTCPQQPGNSSAVFKLVDGDGRELWKNVQQSSQSISAVGMVKTSRGYLLVALEADDGPASKPSYISLTLVSDLGRVLGTNRFVIPLKRPAVARAPILTPDGNLVLAVNSDDFLGQGRVWVNPQTATKGYDCDSSYQLYAIDAKTLGVRRQITVSGGGTVTRLKEAGGRLYAAVGFSPSCRYIEKNLRLIEIDRDFGISTVFETSNVNGVLISDFAVTPGAFVFAGSVFLFQPRALANKTESLEQGRHFHLPDFGDELWDRSDEIANALILVVGRNGRMLADKVFHDVRNRGFNSLLASDRDRFVAGGSTMGDRGWIVGLRLSQRRR